VLYLEDFVVGRTFASGRTTMTAEAIKAFASNYDPQPFHLDEAAGAGSLFGGLVASGWHTAAVSMRLLVDGDVKPAGGLIGAGCDELRWPRPVRPGDELHLLSEVLAVRELASRPGTGMVKLRTTTFNQNEEPVQIFVANLLVPARPAD